MELTREAIAGRAGVDMTDAELSPLALDERAALAIQNNTEAERLIEEFQPFLRGCAARYAMNAEGTRSDELFSVAMTGFYEAIKSYRAEKGHFFPFASGVVRRRIIDEIRKSYRREQTVSMSGEEDEQKAQSDIVSDVSIRQYSAQQGQQAMALEIEQFKAELSTWDITLADLTKQSPKHAGLREVLREAIHKISLDDDIMQTIQLKRYFPVKKAAELTGVPLKKLERARSYILASLIILTGDYDYMSGYVRNDRR